MSKKLYFSPSSQPENRYAYGNTNEQEQCNKIALKCAEIAKRCGFQAKTNTNSDMYGRTKESNDWGADLHMPIHTNAANRKVQGTRLFSFDAKGTGYKVCQEIMKTLSPITPGRSDSITVQRFYEITNANAPTAYIEVAFHDNVEEAKWIIGHTKEIAEAIVKGICNYYGVKYVSESVSKPSKPTTPSTKKSDLELACEVLESKHGNGKDREKKLGSQYDAVQKVVNFLESCKDKSDEEIAKLVWQGKFGNDEIRKKAINLTNHRYDVVQAIVNKDDPFPSLSTNIKAGDKVKPIRAYSYDGVKLDSWVLNKIFPVIEADGKRIVLGNGLNTAFNANDLRKI